jgi:hypothetical protein
MANQKVAARLQVGPNCLLFLIDETGHETFADKNYPVFGLGGCATNSSSAAAVIAEPWRAMKAAHFGCPLHANELRNPTTEQLDALSKFFREQQFARPAVTMSKSAVLPTGKTPLEIITGSMINRYTDLLRRISPEPNEVAFLHEASNRLDDAMEQHFGGAVRPDQRQNDPDTQRAHRKIAQLARAGSGGLHHARGWKKGCANSPFHGNVAKQVSATNFGDTGSKFDAFAMRTQVAF